MEYDKQHTKRAISHGCYQRYVTIKECKLHSPTRKGGMSQALTHSGESVNLWRLIWQDS